MSLSVWRPLFVAALVSYLTLEIVYRVSFVNDPEPPTPWSDEAARSIEHDRPCTGAFPGSTAVLPDHLCPEGWAVMMNATPSRSGRATVEGTCCPLPFSDILLTGPGAHKFEGTSCENDDDDEYIATGVTPIDCQDCPIRCTKITEKYKLSEPRPAIYWKREGAGFVSGGGSEARRIFWDQLPVALRYGAGRRFLDVWDNDGCVGDYPGSLLVGTDGLTCDRFYYRRLLFKDTTEPVPMYPRCRKIAGLFTAQPKCIP